MRKLTSLLALFLAAVGLATAAPSLAEPGTISISLVRVTKTDIPTELEALIGVAVSTNANDGSGYRSTIEPDSSEACVENRLCGPGRICCEGVCTVCHFPEYFDVVFLGLRAFVERHDLFGTGLNFCKWRKVDTS